MAATDWTVLKEDIINYAYSIGVDKIGFTDAEPLSEHLPRLKQREKAGYRYIFSEGDLLKRTNPASHLTDARSIISVAMAYPGQDPLITDKEKCGRVSFVSRGIDYHMVLGAKIEKLKEYITNRIPWARVVGLVDKEEILEKAIAVKAGLGWFGKNTLLVTPEYGSLICLGEIITNIPLPKDKPLPEGCGTCLQCVKSCPSQALNEDKVLNLDLCLAGISQSKGLFDKQLRELMGNNIYGCDICQVACPYNKKAKKVEHKEFLWENENSFPLLSSLLEMTGIEFKKRFGHTSGAWRGRTTFQRNAVIAAGNLKDTSAVPALINILCSDGRKYLRGAAAWSLGKIGTPESITALGNALFSEADPLVVDEINSSLNHGDMPKQ